MSCALRIHFKLFKKPLINIVYFQVMFVFIVAKFIPTDTTLKFTFVTYILTKNTRVQFAMSLKSPTTPCAYTWLRAARVQTDSNVISCVPGVEPNTDTGSFCPIWHKSFSTPYNLNTHLRTVHENEQKTNVSCSYCGKVLKNSNSLRNHVYNFHRE